jgi:hypothetical protein
MNYATPMPQGQPEIQTATGVLNDSRQDSFVTKDGRTVPSMKLFIDGQMYSGFGQLPPLTKGETLEVKYKQNGNFRNLTDIVRAGVSLMPKRKPFGGFGGSGPSNKATLLLAATLIATHNSALLKQPVRLEDVTSLMQSLEPLAAEKPQ